MTNPFNFADTLGKFMQSRGYTPGQLSKLCDLPRSSINNWLNGRVRHPQQWQPLLKLAAMMRLTKTETSTLLQAAGFSSLQELWETAVSTDKQLFSIWLNKGKSASNPPFQVIPDLPYFVGRSQIISDLSKALCAPNQTSPIILHGMAGVGKTSLAAHLAYRLRFQFPDGVLWARLDTSDSMSILATFAAAFGENLSSYTDIASRSRILRNLLTDRRVLMVLDNAETNTQIRPLLPPTGSCAVLVTTRRQALSVLGSTSRFLLGNFAQTDVQELFATILGDRFTGEASIELEKIAQLLGYHPLALVIAASRLAFELGWTAAGLLARLREQHLRLPALTFDDQDLAVSFQVSVNSLPQETQHLFTILGTIGAASFSLATVMAVSGISADAHKTKTALRQLHSLSLIQASGHSHYHMHPLLHDFAREKLTDTQAWERMVAYFVQFCSHYAHDYAALDMERDNLLAALTVAWERGMYPKLWQGVVALTPYLILRGLLETAVTHLNHAIQAAQSQNNIRQTAKLLRLRGQTARCQRDFATAQTSLDKALVLAQQLNDDAEQSAILAQLGVMAACNQDTSQAETYLRQGLSLARSTNQHESLLIILQELAIIAIAQREIERPRNYLEEAYQLAQRLNREDIRANILRSLGTVAYVSSDLAQAEKLYAEGLMLANSQRDRSSQALLTNNLGTIAFWQNQHSQAQNYYAEALKIAKTIGNQLSVCLILSNLAAVAYQQGDNQAANHYLKMGLRIAKQAEDTETIVMLERKLANPASQERARVFM